MTFPQGREEWRRIDSPDVRVDAVRLTEDNVKDVARWCGGVLVEEIDPEYPDENRFGINVMTAAGFRRASFNMYVARYGNAYLVSHNRPFEEMYEPVHRAALPLESAGDARFQRGFKNPWGGF